MNGPQILIVEDEKIIAKDIQNSLTELGYSVVGVAVSGEEAVQKALETLPDLVLMDIVLSGAMGGIEAAAQIRNRLDIPVVYLTAYSDEATVNQAKTTEPFGYILKPFAERELHTTIRMALYKHRTDRKLKAHEQWLSTILQSISEGLIATDIMQYVILTNLVAEALTGWGPTEALGRKLREVFATRDEESESSVASALAQALEKGTSVTRTQRLLVTKSGDTIPIDYSVGPIRDNQGNITGCVLIFRDITDRQLLEKALQQRAAELARANEAKDHFMAIVSHELRTPLNAILGWARLLRTEKLDADTTKRAVETIERNAQAQTQLINDLLDISRITAGKLHLSIRPIQPAQIIEEVIEMMRPAADVKAIRIKSEFDPSAGVISADPDRLHQIIWNLLANAIKFTPYGGHIEIRMERVDSWTEIAVRDTGVGISPEFLPYVFDRFRQAESTATLTKSGLGLGLTIVRQLVELHGGTVQAESGGERKGATFKVRLPYRAEPARTGEPETKEAGANDYAPPTSLEGLRILVVDDEADARDFIAKMLEQEGALVATAASAAEARQALESWKPDIIISDIAMSGEDGYSLLRQVQEFEAGRDRPTPVIALTAYVRTKDRQRARSAGFAAHMAKPVDPEELVATIMRLTGRGQKPRRAG